MRTDSAPATAHSGRIGPGPPLGGWPGSREIVLLAVPSCGANALARAVAPARLRVAITLDCLGLPALLECRRPVGRDAEGGDVTYTRDRQTARDVCGVRLPPTHMLSKSVHAFKTWSGERTLLTWCEIPVDLRAGGLQTMETITCSGCGQNSYQDALRWARAVYGRAARQMTS